MKEYQFKGDTGTDYVARVTDDNEDLTVEVFQAGETNAMYTLSCVDEKLTIDDKEYELQNILYYSYVEDTKKLKVYASQVHTYDEFDGDTEKIEAVESDGIRSYDIPMTKEIADVIADAISL